MDPPLIMEYATSLIRYCDAVLLLEHTAAVEVIVCDSIRPTFAEQAFTLVFYCSPGVATASTTPCLIDSSSCRPPTQSATSSDPQIVVQTAGRWPSRAAARRRCDNNAVACRCDGAGTAARHADGRSLLAAPPTDAATTTPPHVASHRDGAGAAAAGTAARRPVALVPPRLRVARRRRQTAATIADRRPFTPPRSHPATRQHVAYAAGRDRANVNAARCY